LLCLCFQLLGACLCWEESIGTFLEWYQDCYPATSQVSKCNNDSNYNCDLPFGDGIGDNQGFICFHFSTATRGVHVPKHLQKHLWVHHLRICHASFWCWRSLCCRWRPGKKKILILKDGWVRRFYIFFS